MMQAKLVFVASYCFGGKCQSIGSGISISLVGSGQRQLLSAGIRAGVEITSGPVRVRKVETAQTRNQFLEYYLQYHLLILLGPSDLLTYDQLFHSLAL
jgi:hypothetical protein